MRKCFLHNSPSASCRTGHVKASLIKVPIFIQAKRFAAIVDSGSEIKEDMWKQLVLPKMEETVMCLTDANSGIHKLHGLIPKMEFSISGFDSNMVCWISEDCPAQCILGLPWQISNHIFIEDTEEGPRILSRDSLKNVLLEMMVRLILHEKPPIGCAIQSAAELPRSVKNHTCQTVTAYLLTVDINATSPQKENMRPLTTSSKDSKNSEQSAEFLAQCHDPENYISTVGIASNLPDYKILYEEDKEVSTLLILTLVSILLFMLLLAIVLPHTLHWMQGK